MPFDFQAFAKQVFAANGMRTDSNETIVFGRELEQILAQSYDVKYVQNKGRAFVPFMTVGPGVDSVTYNTFDRSGPSASGSPSFIDTYGVADFKNVSVKGKQSTTYFADIGNSYGYNLRDWQKAQQAGRPLDAMLARAAREDLESQLEMIIAGGDSVHNLMGLTNSSDVTIINPTSTTGMSGGTWLGSGGGAGSATVQQIFSDLAFAMKKIWVDTKTIEEADTVVFSSQMYAYLKTTLFQPTYNTKTVLQALLDANPWIKNVDYWVQLDTRGADSKGRVLVYKKDPNIVQFMMGQDFTSSPPIVDGFGFRVLNMMRPGGLQIRYPKAMLYIDGAEA